MSTNANYFCPTTGSRLAGGGTYNRAPDRKSTSPTFSGDETDKDFHFVGNNSAPTNNNGGNSSDKTLKYDSKNFSFRLKNRDSVVISESRGRCSWRHTCCNSLYLGLAITVLVFVIMLLSTSPHNYRYRKYLLFEKIFRFKAICHMF